MLPKSGQQSPSRKKRAPEFGPSGAGSNNRSAARGCCKDPSAKSEKLFRWGQWKPTWISPQKLRSKDPAQEKSGKPKPLRKFKLRMSRPPRGRKKSERPPEAEAPAFFFRQNAARPNRGNRTRRPVRTRHMTMEMCTLASRRRTSLRLLEARSRSFLLGEAQTDGPVGSIGKSKWNHRVPQRYPNPGLHRSNCENSFLSLYADSATRFS